MGRLADGGSAAGAALAGATGTSWAEAWPWGGVRGYQRMFPAQRAIACAAAPDMSRSYEYGWLAPSETGTRWAVKTWHVLWLSCLRVGAGVGAWR
jgi:hypothetical protein